MHFRPGTTEIKKNESLGSICDKRVPFDILMVVPASLEKKKVMEKL